MGCNNIGTRPFSFGRLAALRKFRCRASKVAGRRLEPRQRRGLKPSPDAEPQRGAAPDRLHGQRLRAEAARCGDRGGVLLSRQLDRAGGGCGGREARDVPPASVCHATSL